MFVKSKDDLVVMHLVILSFNIDFVTCSMDFYPFVIWTIPGMFFCSMPYTYIVVLVHQVDDYLHQLPIKELPGIGHTLEEKLKKQNVQTCGQLRMISKVFFIWTLIFFLHALG